jgi:hypothetical protein
MYLGYLTFHRSDFLFLRKEKREAFDDRREMPVTVLEFVDVGARSAHL